MAQKNKSKKTISARSNANDIIKLILTDHKPLKRLVKILGNESRSVGERQKAFAEFAPLLIAHSEPEEQSLYNAMKDQEKLRREAYTGDVEHEIADQLIQEAKRANEIDLWSAKVKVLAELVERHLKEEEEKFLPHFKKFSDAQERAMLGQDYLRLRKAVMVEGGGVVAERKIKQPAIHASH
jgi:hemerythrin superfamily protein